MNILIGKEDRAYVSVHDLETTDPIWEVAERIEERIDSNGRYQTGKIQIGNVEIGLFSERSK